MSSVFHGAIRVCVCDYGSEWLLLWLESLGPSIQNGDLTQREVHCFRQTKTNIDKRSSRPTVCSGELTSNVSGFSGLIAVHLRRGAEVRPADVSWVATPRAVYGSGSLPRTWRTVFRLTFSYPPIKRLALTWEIMRAGHACCVHTRVVTLPFRKHDLSLALDFLSLHPSSCGRMRLYFVRPAHLFTHQSVPAYLLYSSTNQTPLILRK